MCERGEKEIQNKNDMKKYQLYRPLLYQDRRSIDEFIKEDPMWEELCRLYLRMRRQYSKKINSLKTFNTVRFFCTCVMTDPHPEDDIKENYLQPLRGNFRHRCRHLLHVSLCCAQIDEKSANASKLFPTRIGS